MGFCIDLGIHTFQDALGHQLIDGKSSLALADDVCKVLINKDMCTLDDEKLATVAKLLSENAKEWGVNSDDKLAFLNTDKIVLKRLQANVFHILVNGEVQPKACIDFDPGRGIKARHLINATFDLHKKVYDQAGDKGGVVEPFAMLWNIETGIGAIITAPFGPSLACVSSDGKLKDGFRQNVSGYFAEIPSCLQALSQLNIDASTTLTSAANFVDCDGVWKLTNFLEAYKYEVTQNTHSTEIAKNVFAICQFVKKNVLNLFDENENRFAFAVQLTSSLIGKLLLDQSQQRSPLDYVLSFDQVMFGLVLLKRGLPKNCSAYPKHAFGTLHTNIREFCTTLVKEDEEFTQQGQQERDKLAVELDKHIEHMLPLLAHDKSQTLPTGKVRSLKVCTPVPQDSWIRYVLDNAPPPDLKSN